VFGLLGVNGAGKTTTFKMLTGDIIPSEGQAYIYGHEISQELAKTRQYIGYCPQFDALLENVTVQEHLQLYAAIKCIPKHKR
jgi:ATP-binding cassette subfamily A (ABC1) protein 3